MKIDLHCQQRIYSLLNVLFSGVKIKLILHGFPPLGVSNKGKVGKTRYF